MQVEVTSQILSDRVSAMENLQSRLAREIEHTLGTAVAVRLVEPHTLERGQGGAGRIVDKRGRLNGRARIRRRCRMSQSRAGMKSHQMPQRGSMVRTSLPPLTNDSSEQ